MGLQLRFTRGCLAGLAYCCILPQGEVHICPYLPVDVGNVRETTFTDIWLNSPVLHKLRDFRNYSGACGQAGDLMDLTDQKLIKELQGNIPLTENPYAELGRIIGIPESEVIRRLEDLKAAGCLKRIGAVLKHQKSGYNQNAMAVFQVPANRLEEIGNLLAQCPLVSHCYERLAYENWPYNLYAMFHSKENWKIENYIHDFAAKSGITVYNILFSLEELKKTSMVFFE